MLARVDPREAHARNQARAWTRRARTYATQNIKQMVIFGGVSFAVGWVLNVWIMAEHYDGFRTPSGAPVTGQGNVFRGVIFYMVASALISSTISYRLLVGSERFWREIYAIPSSIKRAFTSDGDQTLLHVLVGFSTALLLVLIVGPSVAWVLAVVSLLAFTPVLRPIVTGVLLSGYRWIVGRVAPKRTAMPATVGMMVGIVGSTGAFALGGVLPQSSALIVWLVAIVAAIFVAQRQKPSAAAILIALGTGALAYWFLETGVALADDGGMAECGNPSIARWFSACQGAETVVNQGLVGASGAAVGGVAGAALGGSADTDNDGIPDDEDWDWDGDGVDDGPPRPRDDDRGVDEDGPGSGSGGRGPDDEDEDEEQPVGVGGPNPFDFDKIKLEDIDWDLMPPEMRERIRNQLIHQWREEHRNADYIRQQEAAREIDAMLTGDGPVKQWMQEGWEFAKDTAVFTWNDFKDGGALMSIEGAVEGIYEGLKTGAIGVIDLVKNAPEMLGVAVDFWVSQNPNASIQQIMEEIPGMTREMANQFLATMNELNEAALAGDNERVGQIIGKVAGQAEFEVLMGAGTMKATAIGREAVTGTRIGNAIEKAENFIKTPIGRGAGIGDNAVAGLQREAGEIAIKSIDPDVLARRTEKLAEAQRSGSVKLTSSEAEELFGIDKRVIDERQGTILQYTEGDAGEGMFTVYKLGGDESGLVAAQLRNEHPDIWTGKWNPVDDKGFKPGEEIFMSPEDLARFNENPLQPGETINYKPRELTPDEIADLPPNLKDQYLARQKDAAGWDQYTGFDSRKTIDYSDPNVRARYGEMWVPEDTSGPVKAAEFWKDPADNRVYVRYQTQDGNWSAPRRQASDVDTVTHGGGQNIDYETSRDMQYNQSFGQLGEGDTPNWGMSFIEDNGAGGYVLREGADPNMVFKAIDQLKKADGELVLRLDADGPALTTAEFPQLEALTSAAQTINWTPAQRASLRSWGILP